MTKTRTARRPSRPVAKAGPQYVGRFAWSEYWRHWDEILECTVDELGRSHWTVRRVGDTEVRSHCTEIPEDCIHAAPNVGDGRHLPPQVSPTPPVSLSAAQGA